MAMICVVALAAINPIIGQTLSVDAKVSTESRAGRVWTTMNGRVEGVTEASVATLVHVITDYESYPRLFPQIRMAKAQSDGDDTLLTETTSVSALGIEVVNRFTLRMRATTLPAGGWKIDWWQESTDGTIDNLTGGWELVPTTKGGKVMTHLVYRTASAVPQTIPGQDAVVRFFYPGQITDIVKAVLREVERIKERK